MSKILSIFIDTLVIHTIYKAIFLEPDYKLVSKAGEEYLYDEYKMKILRDELREEREKSKRITKK